MSRPSDQPPTDSEKRAMLARLLRESAARGRSEVTPDPEHRQDPFPLTDVQQAYWIGRSGALDLGNVACHAYYELEVFAIDMVRFNHAWRSMIERHEMLRAVFLPDGRQRILAQVPVRDITVADLRGLPPADVEAALQRTRDRMSHRVHPADRWPLFEIYVSQLDGRARCHLSFDLLPIDFASMRVVFNEFFQLYFAPDTVLPPIELSFRDCVLALERQRSSTAYQRARQYWLDRIAALPPAPELPIYSHRITRPRFVRRTGVLPAGPWQAVKDHAQRAGVTASAVLLTAFSDVLATWSRSPRFCINLTVFSRPPLHPQIHQIIGDFTSLVLVEVDVTATEPFMTRARSVQARLLQDLDHMQYSGVRVMRDLAQARGMAAAAMPVVFTSTISQGRGAGGHPIATFPGDLVYSVTQTPQVWLDHTVFEQDGALVYNWDALEEMFPDGVVTDMFESYRQYLARLTDEPELWDTVGRELVPERQLRARAEINATAAETSAALLHTLFDERARQAPDRLAVITSRRSLSYRELRRRARLLAHELRAAGARAGTLIAVVMEKGWEQVVAVLAILEAGAAYLPIDPDLPALRIQHLLDHGQVALAVTQPWLDASIEWPAGVRRFAVPEDPPGSEEPPALPPIQRGDDLAYVIYTSGSTGVPKGVMIEHRAAVNTIVDINRRFGVGPDDRCLGVSALGFDLSVYDIFGVLAAGGALVLPEALAARDPAHWSELMAAHGVTVWNSAPALMQLLADHRDTAPLPPSLRLVMLSGDWIPIGLPNQIRAAVPGARVISLGGATEAAIWSIYFPIDAVDPAWKSIPYGKPLANQRFHVLDGAFQPCPTWVTGELYIAGAGLARGYWRAPEPTAAQFVRHPRTGERLYRTGDLGRYLPDGNIEFLGRQDFQVKVSGHRIELGEIDAALAGHPEIAEAVALAVGERHDRRLAAAIVPRPGQAPTAAAVRGYLRDRLPDYMVPSSFVFLDRLPLSSNGKVDRKALAEAAASARSAAPRPRGDAPAEPGGEPRSPIERTLVALWREVLKVEHVGIHDGFFDLGGDSLLGVQLLLKARAAGLSLDLQHVLTKQTIAELAPWIEASIEASIDASGDPHAAPEDAAATPLVALQPDGPGFPLFCVHGSDGEVASYLALARCLAGDVPVYGLRSATAAGDRPAIAQMAARYAAAIQTCQPDGPLHLLGWSMGGVVAYEMAHQLRAAGRGVQLVALVDIAVADLSLATPGGANGIDDVVAAYALHYRPELRAHPTGAGRAAAGLDEVLRAAAEAAGVRADDLAPFVARIRDNVQAMRAYQPVRYPGTALVIAGQREPAPAQPALGWDALIATVEAIALPAAHFDLLRPPIVERLADQLRGRIARRPLALPVHRPAEPWDVAVTRRQPG